MSNARGERGSIRQGTLVYLVSLFGHTYKAGRSNQSYLLISATGQALTPAPGRELVPSDVCR
jgi:hypothetical protein